MINNIDDNWENIERNSVNVNDVQRVQRRAEYKKRKVKKNNRKRVVIGILLTLALSLGVYKGYTTAEPYLNGSYVNQSYTVGYESISDNTHHIPNSVDYWYDVDSIARLYDESDMDFDSYVYGAYRGMNMRVVENMDDLFWQFKMRGITDYGKFTDYVKGSGYIKTVDGQQIADIGAWKDAMMKQIRVGNELADVYKEIGRYNGATDVDILMLINGISDVDMYINQVYNMVGWNSESKILCMDELMEDLYNSGYTDYATFFDYCASKGFVKEKNGKMVVDSSAYEKAYKNYVENIEKIRKLMGEVDEFRNGRSEKQEVGKAR